MAGKILALILYPHKLTAAVLQGSALLTFREIPLPEGLFLEGADPDAIVLESLVKSFSLPRLPCILALSGHFLVSRQLNLPRMGEKQLLQNLPFSFRDWLPQPESALYSWRTTGSRDQTLGLSVSAVSGSFIDSLCRGFHRAGLPLRAILPEGTLWYHLLSAHPTSQATGILDEEYRLHLFSQGQPVIDRPLTGDPIALRHTINLYSAALPISTLYCAAPLPNPIPGLQTMPLTDLLPVGASTSGQALALQIGTWTASGDRSWNLIRHRKIFRPGFVALCSGLCCTALLLFLQVGILTPLNTHAQAAAELAQKQSQLETANTALQGYEDVEQAYLGIDRSFLEPEEQDLVSRSRMLSLIRQTVEPYAEVSNLVINDNILTMDLRAVTLEQAGDLLESLEQSPLVSQASMISATADGNRTTVLISITFTHREDPDHETH